MTAQMIHQWIVDKTNLPVKSIQATLQLLDQGATIPFIARYRKEQTQGIDETQIKAIEGAQKEIIHLIQRKESIQKSIEDQNLWTPEIAQKIDQCWDPQTLEDLYLPYKRKRKTKAEKARSFGLEPLAKIIMSQRGQDLITIASKYINKNVATPEEALAGARHIISEWMNEDAWLRNKLRLLYQKQAVLTSKVVASKKDEAQAYRDYWDYAEPLKKVPSHRWLAVRRGETESLLRVQISVPEEHALEWITRKYIKSRGTAADEIALAAQDAWKRLLSPSLENEWAKWAKTKADQEAIAVFANNLRQLLLEPPLGQKRIIAIDPGFRTGCKVVVLDSNGQFQHHVNIYPHPPQNQSQNSITQLLNLIQQYQIEAIAIGNGTAGRETEDFVRQMLRQNALSIEVYIVSESGASIYSASDIARQEFPELDVTVRGAISIGRRLMDPLAELVKIEAKSIGVGQYQHDVQQDLLKDALDHQVISCVNQVGINVNTASAPLLTYVSGIGPVLAQNIIDYRHQQGEFQSKEDLKKVKGLGPKAFEQAAGFLRIKNSRHPLDDSGIHPERYDLVSQIAKDQKVTLNELMGNRALLTAIPWPSYVSDNVGMPTLQDIQKELLKPGLDPRGQAEVFQFDPNIRSITDLQPGKILPGIVTNMTKFGAFVDIGIKENGLIHISQMTDRYIQDPAEVLHLGQRLNVRILDLDLDRKRIQLTLKNVSHDKI